MKIQIEKDKARKILFLMSILSAIFGFIAIFVMLYVFKFMLGIDNLLNFYLILSSSFFIGIITFIWKYFIVANLYLSSLEYEAEESKLTRSYKIIETRKDTARLQVINSVDITQDLIDRIFGVYTLRVDYGFGSEGYVFEFNYLSNEDAEKIADLIKPTGRIKVGIE